MMFVTIQKTDNITLWSLFQHMGGPKCMMSRLPFIHDTNPFGCRVGR